MKETTMSEESQGRIINSQADMIEELQRRVQKLESFIRSNDLVSPATGKTYKPVGVVSFKPDPNSKHPAWVQQILAAK